jgi:hypothetical protein
MSDVKRYEQRCKKIAFNDEQEFENELNKLNMAWLINIANAIPESTDTRQWKEVHYMVQI